MDKQEILLRFKGTKKSGDGYLCLCPAHDDHNPSGYITFKGNWANVHCFKGCSKEEILKCAGLTKGDLYMGRRSNELTTSFVAPIEYQYLNEDGELLYTKNVLYDKEVSPEKNKRKKRCWFVQPNGTKGLKGVNRVLFQLPLLKDTKSIVIVEGEKCAVRVTEEGYIATTLDGGSGSKWDDEYMKYFAGKDVLIIPDNDEPGMKYARMLKKHIPWAIIKVLPDLEESEDIYDWLEKGHSMDELENIEEHIPNKSARTSEDKQNQSEVLLDIIKDENLDFFLNDNNDPYVALFNNGHREILSVDSKEFSQWIEYLYYKNTNRTIRADSLSQVINILSFKARVIGGQKTKLYNRVAKEGNDFWYDMTDDNYSAIKISAGKWSYETLPPILFCRYRHQEPQVIPKQGGDIKKIFEYINLTGYRTLFLCWLVSCFVPDIPHPMPILYGEKGAAKSTACELLKRLIDPSVMNSLNLSKNERSLVVALQVHYYLPFDNVSVINSEVSDLLCRAITGGAVQHHKLYTNGEDYIFKFKRCLTINGINNVANRSDLLDRSIMLELERVPENKRREQQDVYDSFENDRPYLLGAIFDVLSKAIQIYPTVKLNSLPRMADFCRWGYAIGQAIGGYGDEFLNEYFSNQSIQNKEAVDSDVVAFLIVEFMRGREQWCGRVSGLLKAICEEAPNHGINPKNKGIPQYPNKLSQRIKGVKSNLEGVGITYEFDKKRSDGTYITLYNSSSPLPPYYVDSNKILGKQTGDANGDSLMPSELPDYVPPINAHDNGDNGDGGDESNDIIF